MYATGHVELVLIIKSLVLQIGIAALSLTKDADFQQTTAAAVGKLMILMCKSNLLFPVFSIFQLPIIHSVCPPNFA